MILARYGGLIIMLLVSFVASSYLHFVITFNFRSLIEYNLFNRPELVIKYFWGYLREYYNNRAGLPISATLKVILLLSLPFLSLKLIKAGFQFSIFYFAMKIQYRLPTISKFILRKTIFSSNTMDPGINPKNHQIVKSNSKLQGSQNNPSVKEQPKINLRK